jgi:hypothetical protein
MVGGSGRKAQFVPAFFISFLTLLRLQFTMSTTIDKNEVQVTSSGHGVWCAQCTPHQRPPHKKDE